MTSREHYQAAMAIMREVQEMEDNLGDTLFETEVALALNANMMRRLKRAELHLMASGLKYR